MSSPAVSSPAAGRVQPDAPAVELHLLAGFGIRCRGRDVALPPAAERLLAYVALHDRPVHRAKVAGALWLDTPEARSTANLRSALWRLRQVGGGTIVADAMHLRLATDVRVDVRDGFVQGRRLLCEEAEPPPSGAPVFGWLAADLLPDWYDDWLWLWRERWRQLRLHALETLAARLAAAGRYGEAVETALTAVRGEPLRESAHHCLISTYLAEGNRGEALRAYRHLRDLLDRELGVRPAPETRAMLARWLASPQRAAAVE